MTPPGPRSPAGWQMLVWLLRPGRYLEAGLRRHGRNFTGRLWGFGPGRRSVVFVGEPDAARELLDGDPGRFSIGDSRAGIAAVVGEQSILVLDGAEHDRQRAALGPALAGAGGHEAIAREAALLALRSWPAGRRLKLHPALSAVALESLVGVLFAGVAGEGRTAVKQATVGLLGAAKSPLPFGRRRRLERARRELARAARAALIASNGNSPARALQRDLGHEQLDAALATLLMQYEPVGAALSWCFELLLRRPAALERLSAECREPEPTGAYLDAVVAEALRLRPPLAALSRVAERGLQLENGAVPPGGVSSPSSYLAGRDPGLYPQPEDFRPERFLEGAAGPAPDSLAFGAGGRSCLGRGLALGIVRTALATLLAHGSFRAVSQRPEGGGRSGVVLVPARGARAVVERD